MARDAEGVFINVPFDKRYGKLFNALVFAVHECGLVARCALESDDGSQMRMDKIYDIVRDCPLGIHDLSRTTLDSAHRLPRFNMPFELGVFLGAKRYGAGRQKKKSCLILDRERFRYQIYCSDIAGQDIRAHNNNVAHAIRAARNWLAAARQTVRMPGAESVSQRYLRFRGDLPKMCTERHLDIRDLPFLDYRTLVRGWLLENPRTAVI